MAEAGGFGEAELTGRCNCGRVTFRARGPFRDAWGCHCKTCRRQSGHFLTATQTDRAGVTIAGEEDLVWYAASNMATRGFCRACGAHLFWKPTEPGRISILMGALDEPTGIRLALHIRVAEKGDYYDICDGLPQR